MRDKEFEGKTVFITGVAGGIGRQIASDFLSLGALVICSDLKADKVEELSFEMNSMFPGKIIPMGLDVSVEKEVENTISEVKKRVGPIDILINCAGVSQVKPTFEVNESDWNFVMDINAKGVFFCSKFVAMQMIDCGIKGKIVSIASLAGKLGSIWQAHYNASKFAVVGFTQGFALELAKYGININCVCPAFVKTDMQAREIKWECELRGWQPHQVIENYIRQTPLGRLEVPEDVSKVVQFLSSSGADFMTGQAINVTGGVYMA